MKNIAITTLTTLDYLSGEVKILEVTEEDSTNKNIEKIHLEEVFNTLSVLYHLGSTCRLTIQSVNKKCSTTINSDCIQKAFIVHTSLKNK